MTRFYSPAPRPDDEDARQRAVDGSGFLQATGDPVLAGIVEEAAALLGMPLAALSILDHERVYFPVKLGVAAGETPRATSFSSHAIAAHPRPFCVTDAAADGRFAGNPLVLGEPAIRYYAGVALVAEGGQLLGTLCVFAREPGPEPGPEQFESLRALAARAVRRASAFSRALQA